MNFNWFQSHTGAGMVVQHEECNAQVNRLYLLIKLLRDYLLAFEGAMGMQVYSGGSSNIISCEMRGVE